MTRESFKESVENCKVGTPEWYHIKEVLYDFSLEEVQRGCVDGMYFKLLRRWGERDQERKKKLDWINE